MSSPDTPGYAAPNPYQPGVPPLAPPPMGPPPLPPVPTPPAKPARTRLLLASAAAVVVAAGGVATYAAVTSPSTDGAGNPRAAVQRLATALGRGDLLGVVNDLAPNERAALAGPVADTIAQLQRNKVLRTDADLHRIGGVSFSAEHLTFAKRTVPVGRDVQVVQITGGTLRMSADVARLPFTKAFFSAAKAGGRQPSDSRTIDLARIVRSTGHPVRIAVQQYGTSWYPSLFYTVADNAATNAGVPAPTAADRIRDAGAGSADSAVETALRSLLAGDVRRAVELSSPDELAVLHDYGSIIVERAHYHAAPFRLTNITFHDTPAGDGTAVRIERIALSGPNGMDITATLSGSCPTVSVAGNTQRLCPGQLIAGLGRLGSAFGVQLNAAQQRALGDLFDGSTGHGILTSQVDGQWYLNPVHTYAELVPSLLSNLRGDDLLELIALARSH